MRRARSALGGMTATAPLSLSAARRLSLSNALSAMSASNSTSASKGSAPMLPWRWPGSRRKRTRLPSASTSATILVVAHDIAHGICVPTVATQDALNPPGMILTSTLGQLPTRLPLDPTEQAVEILPRHLTWPATAERRADPLLDPSQLGFPRQQRTRPCRNRHRGLPASLAQGGHDVGCGRSEEHTSELQS